MLTLKRKKAASEAHHFNALIKRKTASRVASKASYSTDPQMKKAASKARMPETLQSPHKHTMQTTKKAGVLTEEPKYELAEPKREVQKQ